MPFILTTDRGECICTEADDPDDHRTDCPQWGAPEPTSVAVATLEEARKAALGIVHQHPGPTNEFLPDAAHLIDAAGLLAAGCTIGPLRDGTVIVVRKVGFHELAARVGIVSAHPQYHAAILAAFNAKKQA